MYDDQRENQRLVSGYTLQRTDPYGFWIILDQKSRRVKSLEGSFTTTRDAMAALQNYLTHKK